MQLTARRNNMTTGEFVSKKLVLWTESGDIYFFEEIAAFCLFSTFQLINPIQTKIFCFQV